MLLIHFVRLNEFKKASVIFEHSKQYYFTKTSVIFKKLVDFDTFFSFISDSVRSNRRLNFNKIYSCKQRCEIAIFAHYRNID